MGWQQAGTAGSAQALDWAYLMEPLFRSVYHALATSLEVAAHDKILDMGCGAGLALYEYAQRGAQSLESTPPRGCWTSRVAACHKPTCGTDP